MTSEHTESDHDHAARVRRLFNSPPANWVRETPTDHDVVVVGGGQAGVAIGFALRRAGISRFAVIDQAGPHGRGVWTTIARMRNLRTPKAWPEPEFGFPELSFRNYYERRHGLQAYLELDRIPRTTWAEYLTWVEQIVEVPIEHHTRLLGVRPAGDHSHLVLDLEITHPDGRVELTHRTTRKLVHANGVEGSGGPQVPTALASAPSHLWAHTGDQIDFSALAGRTVAVVGAGASALDAVNASLEAGAAAVHLYTRRDRLLLQAGGFGPGNLGARENFHRRTDADRWALKVAAARAGRSCTLESVERAAAHSGFRVHLGAAWLRTSPRPEGGLRIVSTDGPLDVDFAIAGTGYQYDPATGTDLAPHADVIALWEDRYTPPADLTDSGLGRWPYLGQDYSLQEKSPGRAPWLARIHLFNAAAAMSFGIPIGDVASLSTGVPRLVDALSRDLFAEDQHLADAASAAVSSTGASSAPTSTVETGDPHRHVYAHAIVSGHTRLDDAEQFPTSALA